MDNRKKLFLATLAFVVAYAFLDTFLTPTAWWIYLIDSYVFAAFGLLMYQFLREWFVRGRTYLIDDPYAAACLPNVVPPASLLFCLWFPFTSVFIVACMLCGALNLLSARFGP